MNNVYNEKIKLNDAKIIAINYAHEHPWTKIKSHAHNFWQAEYIKCGERKYIIEGKEILHGAGDFIFIPPGKIHSSTVLAAELEQFNLKFNFNDTTRLISNIGNDKLLFTDKKRVESILHQMVEENSIQKPHYAIILKALIIELLIIIFRTVKDNVNPEYVSFAWSGKIKKAKEHILLNYREIDSVDCLIKVAGMKRTLFYSEFKRVTGYTPINYLNKIKIDKAADFISQKEISLKNIANRVGFEDIYYFHRMFKKIKGISPGKYRQLNH